MTERSSRELPPNAVHPQTRAEWRRWLRTHHRRNEGVWLVSWKVATGKPRMSYDEAVEEALCWGWVDSKPGRLDAERSMLWYAPRKAGSGWSAPNKARVERAIATGAMTRAGLRKVEQAREDGSWQLLDGVEALEVPPDLAAALAAHPLATANFAAFPRSVKRGILEWILQAKRPATRAARVEETARLANANERANQWPRQRDVTAKTPR